MIIHRVRQGETIYSIADMYNVSANLIINNNDIRDPDNLVEGQTLVILFPETEHVVAAGETLADIAKEYNVTVNSILQNNPIISKNNELYEGQTLVISYNDEKTKTIAINGYTYPYIEKETLIRTLPYLTYITIFTYGFTPEGELIEIDDQEVLDEAKRYGVAPILLISSLSLQGSFSNELSQSLLNNEEAQDRLIENLINTMSVKGYYGLDIDFEYVFQSDREAYARFVQKTTQIMNENGFFVVVSLAPKTSSEQKGLLYEAHDYAVLGNAANIAFLMTYEWGYTYGPPMAVAPINKVREVLNYAVTVIPPDKIFMGMPNYGYDFQLPYVRGSSKASSISNVEAVELAGRMQSTIEFDMASMAPFFYYTDSNGVAHVVWFEDAKSVEAKAELVNEYGFSGIGIWNVMKFFPQMWLVLNSVYNIYKVEEM